MRAKDESVVHAGFGLQSLADLSAQSDSLREDVAHHAVQRVRRVRSPHPEIADAPTAEVTLFLEALEREVHRPLSAADSPYQVACVELLAWSPGQERE